MRGKRWKLMVKWPWWGNPTVDKLIGLHRAHCKYQVVIQLGFGGRTVVVIWRRSFGALDVATF